METMYDNAGQGRGFEPFALRPLRLRGVFGAAWQIFKRGFWSMLLLTFLLAGIVSILSGLGSAGSFAAVEGLPDAYGGHSGMEDAYVLNMVGRMLSSIGLSMLLGLVSAFLLTPMYAGAANAEYARRMRGRVSSCGALLRSCGVGLKRYYTTYLAQLLVQFGINLVMFILIWMVVIFGIIGVAASGVMSGAPNVGSIVGMVVMLLAVCVVAMAANLFLAFVYPVAVNENKRHFKAIGRSFRLVAKRFWRVLGANLLYGLAAGVITLLLMAPFVLGLAGGSMDAGGVLWMMPCLLLFSLVASPYGLALNQALYYDAAARDASEPAPFDPNAPIPQDAPQGASAPQGTVAPQGASAPEGARFDPDTGAPLDAAPAALPPKPEDDRPEGI